MRLRLTSASAVPILLVAASCADNTQVPTGPTAPGPSPVLSAHAGKIVINEVMGDPSAVADADGEWIEVHNRGTAAVNIQGWTLASNNDSPHTIANSVSVPAGGYVVLAKSGNTLTNGGVSATYAYGALNLANSSDWVALRDGSGASVDSVAWSTAVPAGSARGVTDPDQDNLDVKGSNWHTAAAAYGGGDDGTPGAQNDGRRSPLTVHILEVGQGDGIYITNGSTRVIIDGGPSMTAMATAISDFGLAGKTVDLMFMTHGHSDHLAGLREFFKSAQSVRVSYFLENKNTNTGTTITSLRDSVNARVGRGELVYRDTDDPCGTGAAVCTFLLDGGARLHVLKPKTSDSNENNRSAAIKLVGPDSASFTMWLSGDAEHEALDWFDTTAEYDLAPGMDVDVVKANHHGSCNGVSSRFLDLTTPALVTMGVSSSNTYSHVHTQTKDLLASRSIPWYRTDENGRITITSPGTPGGGYSVAYPRGTASMSGSADATSASSSCSNL
jgi:beta-lactamase superfamily II metal-dependent hydrolase